MREQTLSQKVSMQKRSCDQCRTEFWPSTANQIYCSATCRVEATHPKTQPRKENCVDCGLPMLVLGKRIRCEVCAERRARPGMKPKACRYCGESFQPTSPQQFYCSSTCRAARGMVKPHPRECRGCGEMFNAVGNSRYCGEPCESPTIQKKVTRLCATCNAPTGHGNRKWCSAECKPKRQSTRKPPRPLYHRLCEVCGEKWYPTSPSVKTWACGACRETKRESHVYTATKGWRKAIRARAKNLCEECGATEQETGAYHHAHHIKPRAEGGTNTMENGKLLCVNCHDAAHGGNAVGGATLRHGSVASLSDQDVERIAVAVVSLLKEQTIQIPLLSNQ